MTIYLEMGNIMETARLEVRNGLKFYISGREITLGLHDLNVSFSMGEFVAITGESGSGKSTLAHILAGIFSCDKGELLLNGSSTKQYDEKDWEQYRRDNISFIAQNYGILPGNTVFDNVVSALRLAGMEQEEAKERAKHLLKQVDLWKWRRRRAARLSSGQKQRLSIARALAKPAPILIADEPTSNLDWGNSCRIIELLAEASKDRLVIVVTHNFEAVRKYATRHIVMYDGEISSDMLLVPENAEAEDVPRRKARTIETEKESQPARKQKAGSKQQKGLGFYIAGLQMKARPVWSVFMVLLFSLTAFAVFAFLGTFFVALDDTGTRLYNNEAFRNGNERRIVVIRKDKEPFTQEDYETLLTLRWAESLQRYDNILDVNYYYRPEIDFEYRYTGDSKDMFSDIVYSTNVLFRNHGLYVQTVPMMKEGTAFLTAGRLPEHMDEVVAVGGEELIGTIVPVYLLDRSEWGEDSYIYEQMTIVGVTDYGNGLYFDNRVGQMLWQAVVCKELLWNYVYGVDKNMEGEAFSFTEEMAPRYEEIAQRYGEVQELFFMADLNTEGKDTVQGLRLSYAGTNSAKLVGYVGLSEEVFDQLSFRDACTQVSLFITDYSYTDRAIRAIEELGYEAISPYRVGSVAKNEAKAKERMTTLVLCLTALFTVVVAQIAVFTAMFSAQMQGYTELCNMGLFCRTGKHSVFWQMLLLTVIGQLIGGLAIFLGADKGVQRFADIVKYLEPKMVVVLSLVHLAAALLAAFAVSRMLQNKVFPFLPKGYDIDLSELEEGEGAEA